jgi:hypothetical protein
MLVWRTKSNNPGSAASSPNSLINRVKSELQAHNPPLCHGFSQGGREGKAGRAPSWVRLIIQRSWSHRRTRWLNPRGRETANGQTWCACFDFIGLWAPAGVSMDYYAVWLDKHSLMGASRTMDGGQSSHTFATGTWRVCTKLELLRALLLRRIACQIHGCNDNEIHSGTRLYERPRYPIRFNGVGINNEQSGALFNSTLLLILRI